MSSTVGIPCLQAGEDVNVHLIDGTYELFRHFYGLRRFTKGDDRPFGAVVGVLNRVLQMIEEGATHLGVATDHVIESFRNGLWSGYKTGDGIEPALWAQFHPLEEALGAMGVAVWPMVELEADDALASAASIAGATPACRRYASGRRTRTSRSACATAMWCRSIERASPSGDAEGVRAKFGVTPELIPDYLALVGDSADGYPGIAGIGPKGAAGLLTRYGRIEDFPAEVLGRTARARVAVQEARGPSHRCAPLRRCRDAEMVGACAGISGSLRAARRSAGGRARRESRCRTGYLTSPACRRRSQLPPPATMHPESSNRSPLGPVPVRRMYPGPLWNCAPARTTV